MDVKKRKIQRKDWDHVQAYIKKEHDNRSKSEYRKKHEVIWKEVDRQITMEPLQRMSEAGRPMPPSWNSAFELGELSKVSEIISADVRRIIFPQERDWFETHVELEKQITEDGAAEIDERTQATVDGLLRSLMAQQHIDFGFKARFELSVKEALHHGSFVAEILWDEEMEVADGDKVKKIAAPTWVPHSMWNCYPDPSPRVIGTNMFYTGSMIIKSYMPLYKLKGMNGDGWMPAQYDKIPKSDKRPEKLGESEQKDVELLTYYGDLVISRKDGDDIYLPNSKAILANGIIVFYKANDLPYPSIIYGGYEKQDVRDPYYTSPIIKQSPIHKLATILANKFVDCISLRGEPPIVYDGNDPYMVQNDGPIIAPGVKTPSKGSNAFQQVEIGDPGPILTGLEMTLRQLQEGTGVSAIRSGVANSDRQTATEVQKVAQGAEVRTIDFIDKLNYNLRSFLYMQHAMNVKNLKSYTFYNADLHSPDFVRITKEDMQQVKVAHFEVTGAKGILGEEQRMQKTGAVTAFASTNPLFAGKLKPTALLLEAYRDAGNKNPERFVTDDEENMVPAEQVEQAVQEATAPLQEELAKMQEELAKAKQGEASKVVEMETKAALSAEEMKLKQYIAEQELALKRYVAEQELALKERQIQLDYQVKMNGISRSNQETTQ